MKYLVQYELDGHWITIARRSGFRGACAKARSEGRAMKWAHHTSVIQDGDPEILRLCAENSFQLRPDPNRRPNQPNHNEKTA